MRWQTFYGCSEEAEIQSLNTEEESSSKTEQKVRHIKNVFIVFNKMHTCINLLQMETIYTNKILFRYMNLYE